MDRLVGAFAPLLLCVLVATECAAAAADACGGLLTDPPNGTVIQSPSYPSKYPSNLNCRWEITVPSGSSVRLTVQELLLESQTSGCKYDYLLVSYGFEHVGAPAMVCMMPSAGQRAMISPGNRLVLQFVTDASLEEKGFRITVDTIDAPRVQGKKAVFPQSPVSFMSLGDPGILPTRLSSVALCASVRIAGPADWTLFTYCSPQSHGGATSPSLGLAGNRTALAFWLGGRATWVPWKRPHDEAWHRVCARWVGGTGGTGGGTATVFADGSLILNASLASDDPSELQGSGHLLLGLFQTAAAGAGGVATAWETVPQRALVGELADVRLWAEDAGGERGSSRAPSCQRNGSLASWSRSFWQPTREGMLVDAGLPAARDVVDNFRVQFRAEVNAAGNRSVDEQLLATVATSWLQQAMKDLPFSTELGNISFVRLYAEDVEEGSRGVTQGGGSASLSFAGTVHLTAVGALDGVGCDSATVLSEIIQSLNTSFSINNASGVINNNSSNAPVSDVNQTGSQNSNRRKRSNGNSNNKNSNNGNNNNNNGNNNNNNGNNNGNNNNNDNISSSNVDGNISSSSNQNNSTSTSSDSSRSSAISQPESSTTTRTDGPNDSQNSSSSNSSNSSSSWVINQPESSTTTRTDGPDDSQKSSNSSSSSSSNSSNSSSNSSSSSSWVGDVGTSEADAGYIAQPELTAHLVLSSVTDLAVCQGEVKATRSKGIYSWPQTRSPFSASVPCAQNPNRTVTRTCERAPFAASAHWLDPDVSACEDIEAVCQGEVNATRSKGIYSWPQTPSPFNASVPCAQNPNRTATRTCELTPFGVSARWLDPDVSACEDIEAICREEVNATRDKGIYSWPQTRSPFNASVPCAQNPNQTATRTCELMPFGVSAQWLDADVSACEDIQVFCRWTTAVIADRGEYEWPSTQAGQSASVPCMQNPESNATMRCDREPYEIVPRWAVANVSNCNIVTASCPNETTLSDKKGSYAWPSTPQSFNTSLPCRQNPEKNATRACHRPHYTTDAEWQEPDLGDCVELFELFNSNVTMAFLTNNSQLSEETVKTEVTSWVKNDLKGTLNYTVDLKYISVTRQGKVRVRRATDELWNFTVTMMLEMRRAGNVDNIAAIVNISGEIRSQLSSTIVNLKPRLERLLGVNTIQLDVPSVGNAMYCLGETLVNIKGVFRWPTVNVGGTAVIACPINKDKSVSRQCMKVNEYSSSWQPIDADVCDVPLLENMDSKSAEDVSKEMDGLMALLEQSPTISVKGAQMVATRFSSILDAPSSSLANSSERALHMVDTLLQKIDFPSSTISLPTKNLLLFVSKMNESDSSKPQEFKDGETSVSLPASLLDSLDPAQKAMATRAQFTIYNNTKLFPQANLSSYVVAASVGKLANITNLKDPVNITLWHTNQSALDPVEGMIKNVKCVYWDFVKKDWNSNGCIAVPSGSDHNVTLCQCNHLTHFALLLDFSPGPKYSEAIEKSLSFITYIGSGLSTIFLGITLVTYITFEKIRTDHPSKILMNLCAALLLLNLLFMLDAWIAWFNIEGLCVATGALLHYSLLASFTWMGLEAVHLYLAVVKVFNTYVRNYILKFCIVGWGVPAVVVAILLAIQQDVYGKGQTNSTNYRERDDFCWIRLDVVFYVAVAGYFCLVFCLNLSMFVVVLRQICQQKRKHGKEKHSSVARELRGSVSLTFLLGITWAFAFLGFGPQKLAFIYLFIIFNTLQGFMIFIFHCALRENVRYQWKKFFCCGKYSDGKMRYTSGNRSTLLLTRKQKQRLSHCSGTSHSTEQTDVTSLNNSVKPIGESPR
ncbi:LOW QUALITY PROTEIN: adhesion G-protein coupled receptor G6-like [Lethenteron reissneri]|uniref:LOW QUALITY PROTEIN: adhesion G-protein coupled receptor G6-like n=1 Tax=Lethenteron reissneri TaxID=7753 RepID=UPI002AB61064|nr:LOW QUALITY PROTEIN: adhesion G-protein coupled receptor G6-like [Lethenteron reissneri]